MAFKDLLEQTKNHPAITTIALFSCLVVGAFGGAMYIKVTEQRTGLLDDRVAQLELDSKNQRKINKVVLSQITALRHGYKNLPTSLKLVKGEFESVLALKILNNAKKEQIQGVIEALATEVNNVQIALEKSEILLKTFDEFLKASVAEQQGDYSLAMKYYSRAAKLGNVDASYRLGTLYASGRGVPTDFLKASKLYRRAALEGNVGARAELAHLYSTGLGVQADYVNALALYKSLEDVAPLSAQAKVQELSKILSPEQIKQAEEKAKKYLETIIFISPNKLIQQTPKSGAADD